MPPVESGNEASPFNMTDNESQSLDDLNMPLTAPKKVHVADHRSYRSYSRLRGNLESNSPHSRSLSDTASGPSSPQSPLTPYLDSGRGGNGLTGMVFAPTTSELRLPLPTISPGHENTWGPYLVYAPPCQLKYPSRLRLLNNVSDLEIVPAPSSTISRTDLDSSNDLIGLGIHDAQDGKKLDLSPAVEILPVPHMVERIKSDIEDPFADPVTCKEQYLSEEYLPSRTILEPEPEASAKVKSTLIKRAQNYIQAHYFIISEPKIVLPYAPNDDEKVCYLNTRRGILLAMGIFSFLSASSGIWLFTVCSSIFAWFSLFAAFVQIHLTIFYAMGIFGKDFDHTKHLQMLQEYPITEETAPSVDIYLPTCKEPLEILENTYRHVGRIQYPSSRIKVHVLDDAGLDSVRQLATRYGFNYILREDRPYLKKAGNLHWAFERTEGEFFVIFDADFCPRADFLLELIPRMKEDPKAAIVQTPQFFRATPDQSWVERGAGSLQEIFYRFVQTNRDKWGAAVCVGSNAVYRREALLGCGGVAGLASSEDIHTGNFAISQGWKVTYVPICLASGVCPNQARAYFSQQVRWCEGSTSLVLSRSFWRNALTVKQKVCFVSGLLYYIASALGIFINPLPSLLLLWFRIQYLNYYTLFMGLPSIIYVQYIDVIQQYAYLSAMVDVVLGTKFNWVPSAIGWTILYQGSFITGVAYRMLTGHVWYYFLPLIILNAFQVYISIPFLVAKER